MAITVKACKQIWTQQLSPRATERVLIKGATMIGRNNFGGCYNKGFANFVAATHKGPICTYLIKIISKRNSPFLKSPW